MNGQLDIWPETLLVEIRNGIPMASSLVVATHFEKRHTHVLRAIAEALVSGSPDFATLNFEASTYERGDGRRSKLSPKVGSVSGQKTLMYYMTEEGFADLVMGFTGRDAREWRRAFLACFVEMRRQLSARTERESNALFQLRPRWRVIRDNPGLRNNQMALLTGHKSPSSITANRRRMRQVGLA